MPDTTMKKVEAGTSPRGEMGQRYLVAGKRVSMRLWVPGGKVQMVGRSYERLRPQHRTVLYTAKNCQLVVMSLKPGEDIGAEVHKLDQFFRVEEGEGKAVLDGVEHRIKPGFAVIVPAGARHNIINGPSESMKLYTLYAPPNHRDGVVHVTKADAEADKEHFDGKTTE
jgi:mannose-6-phosphate isomerase-like protein (cupin superfamily)